MNIIQNSNHFIRAFVVSSLLTFGLPAYAQLETRPTPMWEGIEKTADDIANDQKLVDEALRLSNGDRNEAATQMVQLGWQQIVEGNPNEAIRRFNQAWLVNPLDGFIFWGYGVATHIRGDELKNVERWFGEARKIIKENPRLLADHGRVLEERKLPKRARALFEEALALEETYLPAHVGMVLVARSLKDEVLEAKHQKRHDELVEAGNQ